jgi:hypothetical protein
VLVAFLAIGLNLESARSALAADRQAGAGLRAAAAAQAGASSRRRTCRARSGCSTSGPPGASPAARSIRSWSIWRSGHRADLRPQLQGPREDALRWLKQFGDPYALSIVDAEGRVGIDYGVYGVPETYVIDKAGVIRFKQIGPVTQDVLEKTILPLVKELQK